MTTTLQTVIDEGRLIRGTWARVENGRQLLCLYTALAGDPGARPETCPASLAPQWLAYLLQWMDDDGSLAAWPAMVARVAALAPTFGSLPPSLEWRVRALCVREAMRHTDDASLLAVCEHVAMLCERRGKGEVVPSADFEAVATVGAAQAAARAAAGAAGTAWPAAEAAAWAATPASAEARAAAVEAGVAAQAAAADQLTTAILDEIEAAGR